MSNDMIRQMHDTANEIQQIELLMLDNKLLAESLKEHVRRIENERTVLIENAVNAEGKKLYSNDIKRRTAITEQLSKNDEYNTKIHEIKELETGIEKTRIHRDFLARMFRFYETALLRGE